MDFFGCNATTIYSIYSLFILKYLLENFSFHKFKEIKMYNIDWIWEEQHYIY